MKIWAGAVVAVTVGFAAQASAQSGDPAKGQRVFNQQCRACHTLEKDGAQTAGPNLHGVFGRKAGTAAGYEFSEAMKASGIVWDETTMADYETMELTTGRHLLEHFRPRLRKEGVLSAMQLKQLRTKIILLRTSAQLSAARSQIAFWMRKANSRSSLLLEALKNR